VQFKNAASISSTTCALALAALLSAGCGSHKSDIRALSSCEAGVENAAAADVVRKAFAAGSLGTADSVARAYFKGGEPRSSYLDASGKLRPYSAITNVDARYDLEAWMAHIEGQAAKLSDKMFTARMHARSTSPCKDKTQ
jgi:hypothetical protein